MKLKEALNKLEELGVEVKSTKFYDLGTTEQCNVIFSKELLVVMTKCSDDEIACEVYVDGLGLWWPKNFSKTLKNKINLNNRRHTSVLKLKFLLTIVKRMIT